MANDPDKTGQQGGTDQNNPGGFENDPHPPSSPVKGADRRGKANPTLNEKSLKVVKT